MMRSKGTQFKSVFITGTIIQMVVLITIFFVGFSSLITISKKSEENITMYDEKKRYLINMRSLARERIITLWKAALNKDPFERINYQDQFLSQGTEFLIEHQKYLKLGINKEEQALVDKLFTRVRLAGSLLREVMEDLATDYEDALKFDIELRISLLLTKQDTVLSTIDEIIEYQNNSIEMVQHDSSAKITDTLILIIQLMFVAILLGGLFAFRIIQQSNVMLLNIKESKKQLSSLNLELEQRVENRTNELQRANKHLERLAKHDPLTGLANRILLFDQMNVLLELASRGSQRLAVFFLDLDHFKKVNDSHGHDTGDLVLVRISDLLKANTRDSDLVARIGGDEFIIVLADANNLSSIEGVANKIISATSSPMSIGDKELSIGATIGISLYPDDANDIPSLLKYADKAMYFAKQQGKNCFSYYNAKQNKHLKQVKN